MVQGETQGPGQVEVVRCALYTRKSNQDGLDQNFTSLDAQREAGEAYVASQKSRGWVVLPDRYDDGGFSGGTLARPAFKRLLTDVEADRVDCIVVYKYDRLSRSLSDFLDLMKTFEQHGVSFVSVTQPFETTTSTGRLMLNMLLSFAQFERENCSDRIRDKIAAAKRKGMHTGGNPILGYDAIDRKLVVNEEEANLVRHIFKRFCQIGSATKLARELNAEGHRTKTWTNGKGQARKGVAWNKGHLYRLLNNRKYIGEVTHKDKVYPGEHKAIVSRERWDDVHRILAGHYRTRANKARARTPALLKGVIWCGHCGTSMGISYTKRKGRAYRYYLCGYAAKHGYDTCPVRTVRAGEIEQAVIDQLRNIFRTPELIAATYREAAAREGQEIARFRRQREELQDRLEKLKRRTERLLAAEGGTGNGLAEDIRKAGDEVGQMRQRIEEIDATLHGLEAHAVTERDVIAALQRLDPIWDELFPAEQNRIVKLLIKEIVVREDGLEIRLRGDGLHSMIDELSDIHKDEEAA